MTELLEKARLASTLATSLALCTTNQKNDALLLIANQLVEDTPFILQENKKDLEAGKQSGMGDHLLDRLQLT
ncbi:MAG: gamma-glutamyl-phosphate reductase, partial [Bacillus sp. (in: firmicutes)]